MEIELSYFRRRASEEKAAALRAGDPQAQQAHLDMAGRYENLVQGIIAREEFRGFRLPTSGSGGRLQLKTVDK